MCDRIMKHPHTKTTTKKNIENLKKAFFLLADKQEKT